LRLLDFASGKPTTDVHQHDLLAPKPCPRHLFHLILLHPLYRSTVHLAYIDSDAVA
jgi:hypothetical protein